MKVIIKVIRIHPLSTMNIGQRQIQKYVKKLVLKAVSGLLKCTFSIFVGFISFEMTFAPFFTKGKTECS